MPRRTRPLKSIAAALFDSTQTTQLRRIVEELIKRESRLCSLPADRQEVLVADVIDAVGYATAGLTDILAGKRAKPAAWTMDIFVHDVCAALRAVGIPYAMSPAHEESRAQCLAKRLAEAAGLAHRGELFHQMQRAQCIKTVSSAKGSGLPVLILGKWQVLNK